MSAAPLTAASDLRGVLAVGGEYALLAGAVALALRYPEPWLYPLLVLVIGTRQYALAESLTHEAVHGNLCATRWLNEALGRLTTWPFFYVLGGYRRYHLEHHRVALDDPDNNVHEQYADWGLPPPGRPLGRARAWWLFAGRPLLGVMALHHARTLASNAWWDRDLAENWLMLAAWAGVCALAWRHGLAGELVALWIVPQLLVIGTLDFWSESADHYRVSGGTTRSHLGWTWNTFISHNIGYHALHHRFPGIPWFRLPAAWAAHAGAIEGAACHGFAQALDQVAKR